MCGIAGYVAENGQPVDPEVLGRMVDAVKHRGPDGEGMLIEGKVGLGHRRLAIVDLSQLGHQPMSDQGERLTIVYNGEIYNHIELRRELEALGHFFHTTSDTEVLIAAYAEWGADCVQRFNGMWSFAILDRGRNELFCSRDRFGVKPFYFARTSVGWCFGSEIRQLLPLLERRQVNWGVLLDFLVTCVSDHTAETFFAGVSKLSAGHNLVYDLAKNSFEITRYYSLRDHFADAVPNRAVAEYQRTLEDAVNVRLRADVPVGTCLSGGLDSSSVATLASPSYRAKSGDRFRAITAVSEQASNDESAYAAQVVESSDLEWLRVRPDYKQFLAVLPQVVEAQEEPFGSASIVMQYLVMQTARDAGIPVLLDGQGGDETLLGYERYFAAHYLDLARRAGWSSAVRAMIDSARNNALMKPVNILKYLFYFSSVALRRLNFRRRHRYLKKFPRTAPHMRAYAHASRDIKALQRLEIEHTNLPALLRYEDKNSMWHSIETRLPFLDYRLVELALSLPGELKISGGWTKHLLRRVMDGRMPASITWRRNKNGFEAPNDIWLKLHAEEMRQVVLASSLLGHLSKPGALKRSYASLDANTRWRLYSIALWETQFGVVA